MSEKLRAYLIMHFCVFIWGFTAILGKLITLKAVPLVWWRVIIASSTLFLLIPRKLWKGVSRTTIFQFSAIGVMIGIHWLCFYGAIKLSNASVAVATMATSSFFSALTEPFLLKQKVKWYELLLSLIILPGMAMVVGNISWNMQLGFALGTFGAFLAAVFSSLNKKMLEGKPPPTLVISCIEMSAATITCSIILPFLLWYSPETRVSPSTSDWLWLFILAWVCTLLPHYLSLRAMRHITAFGANLTLNLEPVYGIVLAAIWFREDKELNPHFYLGMSVILIAVISHPFLKYYFETPKIAIKSP